MSEIDSSNEVLETRYAKLHVGGAFNAKNILTPKSVEDALKDATFGKTPDKSLLVDGLSTERYGDIISRSNLIAIINKLESDKDRHKVFSNSSKPTPQSTPVTRCCPPIVKLPLVSIYWNTDPDIWNTTGSHVGQINWDS